MPGSLNTKEEKVVAEFIEKLKSQFGKAVKMTLLYGSKARGDDTKKSDIDLFVLLDKADYKIRDKIVDLAFDLFLEHEVLISPRVISMNEYELLKRWETSFYKNLQKDGIKL